jgi:hypothetical protein
MVKPRRFPLLAILRLCLLVLVVFGGLCQQRVSAQSLILRSPSSVARGGDFTATVEGSSSFDLTGFAARVVYDPGELICTGQSFVGSVWENADFRSVDDSDPGSIAVVAVEDTTNSGVLVQAGNDGDFVDLFFEARICIGPVVIGFGGGVDDNIFVDATAVGFDLVGGSLQPVTIEVVAGESFVRGNANNSPINAALPDPTQASVTIADAIFVLNDLFGQGSAPACLDAADANDDSRYDIVDAVTVLQLLFGNPLVFIPEPHTNMGIDEGGLGCLNPPNVVNCPE